MMNDLNGIPDYNTVFCDWLNVTYSPDDDVVSALGSFFSSADILLDKKLSSPIKFFYRLFGVKDFGTLVIEIKLRFVSISASGAFINSLRHQKLYSAFLSVLGLSPFRVTRLDLSLDVETDFPLILHGLRIHYPDGLVSFSKRKVPSHEHLSHRSDGAVSGTYYIGTPKSKISARIYDKQFEVLEKYREIIPTRTRYEITFRGGSVSLKDAYDCAPLFWHHSSTMLLDHLKPADVPDWFDGSSFTGWEFKADIVSPYFRMKRLIEDDSVFDALARLSTSIPNGRSVLDDLLKHKVDAIVEGVSNASS